MYTAQNNTFSRLFCILFACNLNYCVVIASLAMPAIKLKKLAFTIISRVSALEGVPDTVGQSDDGGEDVLSGA